MLVKSSSIHHVFEIIYTVCWGISVMVLLGAEVAATSEPNKTVTLIPQRTVF